MPFLATRTVEKLPPTGAPGFLVGAMYTSPFLDQAEALRESCEKNGLPYVLCEVPAVHSSISTKGSPDLRFTKPNFIRHLLERYRRPILYMDADCVVRARPALIGKLLDEGIAFAIYNWLADASNESFYPIDVRIDGETVSNRFFKYSHRVGMFSNEQLVCSGCVQLFGTSPAALALLALWQQTIESHPGVADDHCLDFAFNNGGRELENLRRSWLPKEYARYGWWIFTRPVLDHPGYPSPGKGWKELVPHGRLARFYGDRCVRTASRFSENSYIDVIDRSLYAYHEGKLSLVESLDGDLYISPADGT